MGVDLLLVLGLQDEDDLYRNQVVRVIAVGKHELGSSVNGELGRVLLAGQ